MHNYPSIQIRNTTCTKNQFHVDMKQLCKLPFNVYWKNLQSVNLGCNDLMLEMLGVNSDKDIIGTSPYDVLAVDEASAIIKNDSLVTNQGRTICIFESGTLPSLGLTNFLSVKMPLYNNNVIVGSYGMSINLSARDANIAFDMLAQTDAINYLPNIKRACYKNFNDVVIDGIKLSKREAECLYLLAKGKMTKEIGYILNLSARTVEYYISNMKDKLNCCSRSQLLEKLRSQEFFTLWLFL